MTKLQHTGPAGWVLRPAVTLTILYLGLCAVWFVWTVCTTTYPLLSSSEPQRLLGGAHYLGFTVANAVLLAVLAFDGALTRREPRGQRAGPIAGIALAAVALAVLQLALYEAHRAIPLS